MSSDIAISVEGLSKCYLVGHNAKANADDTLRDHIVRHARNLARKTSDMAHGRAIVQGDSIEEFWALRDVAFEIPRGARVGILGRNGAGKSTLLKLLSRITEPTKGRIALHGRVASLLEVGTGFHPELTGRENVFLNGAILGMSRQEIQSKFDEIVQFAEVERFLDTPVKRYSSGMYVRLAFAVAAHLDPEIMIVDEVLAVGDAQFQKKCLGRMEEVGRSGRTVIFVSHNVAAVRQLCETAIYLQNGQLIAHSNVEDAISRYMEHGSEDASYKVWSKGVGEGILLCEAEVCGSSGSRRAEFSANEDINLRFGVKVERFTKEARIGFRLMSLDGTIIFTSEDSDTLKLSTSYGVGDHQLSATIPAGLLNEGVYSVTAGAHVPNDRILFFEESVLRFRVNASGALGSETPATRLGFIRPRLNWTLA